MAVPTLIGWQYVFGQGNTVGFDISFDINGTSFSGGPFLGTVVGDLCAITLLSYSPIGAPPTIEVGHFSGSGVDPYVPSAEWTIVNHFPRGEFYASTAWV